MSVFQIATLLHLEFRVRTEGGEAHEVGGDGEGIRGTERGFDPRISRQFGSPHGELPEPEFEHFLKALVVDSVKLIALFPDLIEVRKPHRRQVAKSAIIELELGGHQATFCS
jgi:hypothetical protein